MLILISGNILLTKPDEFFSYFALRFKVLGLISDLKVLFETELLKGVEDENHPISC